MAVYKIFPEKTTTLFSSNPLQNTGLDEIIEVSADDNNISRALIQFDTTELSEVISKTSGSYDSYLKIYLANNSLAPTDYTLSFNSLSRSWDMGNGKLNDKTISSKGANWNYSDAANQLPWVGGEFSTSIASTQRFQYKDNKDIEVNINPIVAGWLTSNNGLIIKQNDESLDVNLKYFSGNTHTIYPPCLEIRWDDSVYQSTAVPIINSNVVLTLSNNKKTYQQNSVQKFRINVRDRFPARKFQSYSVYLDNKILPATSWWSIKDLDTEETIVDFDPINTKISADNVGNYFKVFMNGLQPERYYKFLFKYEIDGEEIISDDSYYFKVVR